MKRIVKVKDRLSGEEVEAEVFDQVTMDDFNESQEKWRPVKTEVVEVMKATRAPLPNYMHWDWRQKSGGLGRLDISFFGLRYQGSLQGLMKADTGSLERCRLPGQEGKELVLVDYVETAPWNIPEYMGYLEREAVLARVGVRLMQEAVQLSIDSELKGRVGLYSLPRAEEFYFRLGMVLVERDPKKQNLRWCEFTPEAAHKFMEAYP